MNEKKRGFDIVSSYQGQRIALPTRKTAASAGYDLAAAETVRLLPHQVTIVPTGLKAYMQPNEYLGIHVRSGISIRHAISCVNDEGIIDADYYNNPENEGHIMVALYNHGDQAVVIDRGMRVAQGIFYAYLTVDDDMPGEGSARQGGFGSTGLQ